MKIREVVSRENKRILTQGKDGIIGMTLLDDLTIKIEYDNGPEEFYTLADWDCLKSEDGKFMQVPAGNRLN